MASYSIDFDEVNKQHNALNEQLDQLAKVLDDMVGIQENMLGAAQWNTADKGEFTTRFENFIQSGRNLHAAGTAEADALQRISDTYRQAEQG